MVGLGVELGRLMDDRGGGRVGDGDRREADVYFQNLGINPRFLGGFLLFFGEIFPFIEFFPFFENVFYICPH
jgi:hypothetical protein